MTSRWYKGSTGPNPLVLPMPSQTGVWLLCFEDQEEEWSAIYSLTISGANEVTRCEIAWQWYLEKLEERNVGNEEAFSQLNTRA